MRRDGFLRRLSEARRRLKERHYAELRGLVQGNPTAGQVTRVLDLVTHLAELEREDGEGGLGRLLAGLPGDLAIQLRQELRRSLDEEGVRERQHAAAPFPGSAARST
jgi:hypothetical protein